MIPILLTFTTYLAWVALAVGVYLSAVAMLVLYRSRGDEAPIAGCLCLAAFTVPVVSLAWIVATWGVS